MRSSSLIAVFCLALSITSTALAQTVGVCDRAAAMIWGCLSGYCLDPHHAGNPSCSPEALTASQEASAASALEIECTGGAEAMARELLTAGCAQPFATWDTLTPDDLCTQAATMVEGCWTAYCAAHAGHVVCSPEVAAAMNSALDDRGECTPAASTAAQGLIEAGCSPVTEAWDALGNMPPVPPPPQ